MCTNLFCLTASCRPLQGHQCQACRSQRNDECISFGINMLFDWVRSSIRRSFSLSILMSSLNPTVSLQLCVLSSGNLEMGQVQCEEPFARAGGEVRVLRIGNSFVCLILYHVIPCQSCWLVDVEIGPYAVIHMRLRVSQSLQESPVSISCRSRRKGAPEGRRQV